MCLGREICRDGPGEIMGCYRLIDLISQHMNMWLSPAASTDSESLPEQDLQLSSGTGPIC